MEHLLQPDPGLLVWTIVIFLALVVVLKKFTWRPLLQALKQREDNIRRAIENAQSARQTAEQLKAEVERELAEGQSKAQAMLAQTRSEAQRLREKLLQQAQDEAKRLSEQTRRELGEEKAKLIRELRGEVAGLSILAAEKLVHHAMNPKVQDELLDEFFKDLEKQKMH
jgi:F-type H+-transporting ATPase subunit b